MQGWIRVLTQGRGDGEDGPRATGHGQNDWRFTPETQSTPRKAAAVGWTPSTIFSGRIYASTLPRGDRVSFCPIRSYATMRKNVPDTFSYPKKIIRGYRSFKNALNWPPGAT